MFARLLATLSCVLPVGVCLARAEAVASPDRQVDVYLATNSNQPIPPIQEMKREVAALLKTAGYRVSWHVPGAGSTENPLVVVELRGSCQAPWPDTTVEPVTSGTSLASTAVSNGQVQPFTWLECDTLIRLLAPAWHGQPPLQRDQLFGRAMGRLLAHELLHYLTHTEGHDTDGIGKPSFSAKEVLAEHFDFAEASLERFRNFSAEDAEEMPSDVGAGR